MEMANSTLSMRQEAFRSHWFSRIESFAQSRPKSMHQVVDQGSRRRTSSFADPASRGRRGRARRVYGLDRDTLVEGRNSVPGMPMDVDGSHQRDSLRTLDVIRARSA